MQVKPNDPSGGQFSLIYGSSDTVHISSRFGHLEAIDYDTEETPALLKVRVNITVGVHCQLTV